MSKSAKYEKILQLVGKKTTISLEDCQKKYPEISSGTFHSTMNTISKHNLVKKIPLGKRRMAYQKTYEYTIEKAIEILKAHHRNLGKKYRKKPIKPQRLRSNQELTVSKSITEEEQEIIREAKWRIHNLVEDYMRVLSTGKKRSFNEERAKIAFVIPLLEALGWEFLGEAESERAGLNEVINFVLGTEREAKILVEVESPSKSLDEYRITREGSKSCAALAIQHAWDVKADWVLLTNFEETRLFSTKVKKPEDGLIWKMRFTEYESRFDELAIVSRDKVFSGALGAYESKIEKPVQYDRITDLLKREGPLTRRQILEKLGLSRSYQFPWFVRKFGSRRRKVYYLEGQEDIARGVYEEMLKPKPRVPSWPYPKEYFLNFLNLKRTRTSYSPSPDGTPTWWERRANRQYDCSACRGTIKKSERYIARKILNPGMRGIYGYRGTYETNYYHIVCLLRDTENKIEKKITYAHREIYRLRNEITAFKNEIPLREGQIENCNNLINRARKDYEDASFWRKFDKWIGYHYTSSTKGKEISRLKNTIEVIKSEEIPERETEIADLQRKINRLKTRLGEIQARIQELTNFARAHV